MVTNGFVIVGSFPEPPPSVQRAWELLEIARRGDADEIADSGIDLHALQRPWVPAQSSDTLREGIWEWCDAVAAWINREYAWKPVHLVPPCWPRHPHIANELPGLVFSRWLAADAFGPEALEDWHRYTFPMFLDRMQGRLGESTCRTGRHQDWPAETRYTAYVGDHLADDRADLIFADTHPTIDIHSRRA